MNKYPNFKLYKNKCDSLGFNHTLVQEYVIPNQVIHLHDLFLEFDCSASDTKVSNLDATILIVKYVKNHLVVRLDGRVNTIYIVDEPYGILSIKDLKVNKQYLKNMKRKTLFSNSDHVSKKAIPIYTGDIYYYMVSISI